MALNSFGLPKFLRRLKDPRLNRRKRHLLGDVILMAICAVIAEADTWQDIATFARLRKAWFQRFLELPNGIPSHHTFRRVLERLDPQTFQRCLVEWLHYLSDLLGVRHIAIDGKTLRHSGGGSSPLRQLHLVSAWATDANLTLGQVATEAKSNEITAIPRLLALLELKGAWVSIDAMGCQKEIAQRIVDGGGDYVLTVKDNQERLKDDILNSFIQAYDNHCENVKYDRWETVTEKHGRHEYRVYEVLYDLDGIRDRQAWAQLPVIGKCYSERTLNGKTSSEDRYFIGSRHSSAKVYGKVLRNHWRIENNLHWQMDVTFGEDASHIHSRSGGQNFALLRRIALGLLKQHPSQESIGTKRYKAALDVNFLEEILKQ